MNRPEDDPLGAVPSLPQPTGEGARRAAEVFRQVLRGRGELRTARLDDMASAYEPLPNADGFARGRRYDAALAYVAALERRAPEASRLAEGAMFSDSPSPARESNELDRAVRPPLGAATIRPSVRRPTGPEAVPQELLETTADTALLVNEPDGATSFEVSFKDDVFADLRCKITVHEGRVVAAFQVQDANLRRLIEAEAGRLRAQLEERGLRVEEVRVDVATE